ncbi:MAG: acyltransferase family protein [Firmicutes bacterium]|nr:acyltransferase family protein [Bacillota bacterium]
MSQRDYLYDNIKGLLIILVVLCHLLGCAMMKSDTAIRAFVLFVYYFHMPLFIFISGYFSKNVDKCRDNAFRSLFMVYIVAQVFWIIFKYLTNGSTHYIENFLDPGYAIWYIVALFFWRVFLKDLTKLKGALIIAFLISPLIMFLPKEQMILAINKTVGFLFFFLLGYYCNKDHIAKIRRIPWYVASLLLLAIFGGTYLLLDQGVFAYGGAKSIFMYTATIQELSADLGNVWYGLGAYYDSMIVAMICSALVIAAVPGKKTFLAYVGGDTLPLYLSHTYFIILLDMLFAAYTIPHSAEYAIVVGLSTALIILFSTGIYRKIFHRVYETIIGLICPKPQKKEESVK